MAEEILELILDAPPRNIIDSAMCERLLQQLRGCSESPPKAIVLRAQGEHFSFGASIEEHRSEPMREFLPRFHSVFRELCEQPAPVIAAVSGLCLGGAFELAAACDLIIADTTAQFAVPEILLGVLPPVACALFPWKYGGSVASDLVLSGRRMGAEEAHVRGIVARLGDLEPTLNAFLSDEIRSRSASALRFARQALSGEQRRRFLIDLREQERFYLEEVMTSADAQEGIEAFLQHRAPNFGAG
jgi:cyclohexa-1,5-dienecarbonyl-CoA hydratase